MLMLKMLVLKMVKKYLNIYKYKLSLFARNDTKQAKSLIFIVLMLLHFFIDSGNLFHFEGPKTESEF